MKYSDINNDFHHNLRNTSWSSKFPYWISPDDPLTGSIGDAVEYTKAEAIFKLLNTGIKPAVLLWLNPVVDKQKSLNIDLSLKNGKTFIDYTAPLFKTYGNIKITNTSNKHIKNLTINITEEDSITIYDLIQPNETLHIDIENQKFKIEYIDNDGDIKYKNVSISKTGEGFPYFKTTYIQEETHDWTYKELEEFGKESQFVIYNIPSNNGYTKYIYNPNYKNKKDPNYDIKFVIFNQLKHNQKKIRLDLSCKNEEDININCEIELFNTVFNIEQNIEVTSLELFPIKKIELYCYTDMENNNEDSIRRTDIKEYHQNTKVLYDLLTFQYFSNKFYVKVWFDGLDFPYEIGFPQQKEEQEDSIFALNSNLDNWGEVLGLPRRPYKEYIPEKDLPYTYPPFYPYNIEQDYWYYQRLINEYCWNDQAINDVDLLDTDGNSLIRLHSINPFVEDFVVTAQSKIPKNVEYIKNFTVQPTNINVLSKNTKLDDFIEYYPALFKNIDNLNKENKKATITLPPYNGKYITYKTYMSEELDLFFDLSEQILDDVNIEGIEVIIETESTDNSLDKYNDERTRFSILDEDDEIIYENPIGQSGIYEINKTNIHYGGENELFGLDKTFGKDQIAKYLKENGFHFIYTLQNDHTSNTPTIVLYNISLKIYYTQKKSDLKFTSYFEYNKDNDETIGTLYYTLENIGEKNLSTHVDLCIPKNLSTEEDQLSFNYVGENALIPGQSDTKAINIYKTFGTEDGEYEIICLCEDKMEYTKIRISSYGIIQTSIFTQPQYVAYNNNCTFDVQVKSINNTIIQNGTIECYIDDYKITTSSVDNNIANIFLTKEQINNIGAGLHELKLKYSGGNSYKPATYLTTILITKQNTDIIITNVTEERGDNDRQVQNWQIGAGKSVNISTQITTTNHDIINSGKMKIYIDGEDQNIVKEVQNGIAILTPTLDKNLSIGEHIFTIKYIGSYEYKTTILDQKFEIIGGDTYISIFDIGDILVGEPTQVIAKITDNNNNPVNIGTVKIKIYDSEGNEIPELQITTQTFTDGIISEFINIPANVLEIDEKEKQITIEISYTDDEDNIYFDSISQIQANIYREEVVINIDNVYGYEYEPIGFLIELQDSKEQPVKSGNVSIQLQETGETLCSGEVDKDGYARLIYNQLIFPQERWDMFNKFEFKQMENDDGFTHLYECYSEEIDLSEQCFYLVPNFELIDNENIIPNDYEDGSLVYWQKNEEEQKPTFILQDKKLYIRTRDTIIEDEFFLAPNNEPYLYKIIYTPLNNTSYYSAEKNNNQLFISETNVDIDLFSYQMKYSDELKITCFLSSYEEIEGDKIQDNLFSGNIELFIDNEKITEKNIENNEVIFDLNNLYDPATNKPLLYNYSSNKHLLSAKYTSLDKHQESCTYSVLDIEKSNVDINVECDRIMKGKDSNITVTLSNPNKSLIIDGNISLYIKHDDDEQYEQKGIYTLSEEDFDGENSSYTFSIPMGNLIGSEYYFKVYYEGNYYFNEQTYTSEVYERTQQPINLYAESIKTTLGSTCILNVIGSSNEDIINEGYISVYINDSETSIAGPIPMKNNIATLTWKVPNSYNIENYTLRIEYSGSDNYKTEPTFSSLIIIEELDEVYLSIDGHDTFNTGTKNSPFLTIKQGVDCVKNNGTVYILDGTYLVKDLIIDKNISFIGYNNCVIYKEEPTPEESIIEKLKNAKVYEIGSADKNLDGYIDEKDVLLDEDLKIVIYEEDLSNIDPTYFDVDENGNIIYEDGENIEDSQILYLGSDGNLYGQTDLNINIHTLEAEDNITINSEYSNISFYNVIFDSETDFNIKNKGILDIKKSIINNKVIISNYTLLTIGSSLVYGEINNYKQANLDTNWWGSNTPKYDSKNNILLKLKANENNLIIGENYQLTAYFESVNGKKYDLPIISGFFTADSGIFGASFGDFIDEKLETIYSNSTQEGKVSIHVDDEIVSLPISDYQYKTNIIVNDFDIPLDVEIPIIANINSLDQNSLNEGYCVFILNGEKIGKANVNNNKAKINIYFDSYNYNIGNYELIVEYYGEKYLNSSTTKNIKIISSDNICFIDPGVKITGNGSFNNPFKTIKEGLNKENIQTIYLKESSGQPYSEYNININKNICIKNFNTEILYGGINEPLMSIFNIEDGCSVELYGITFIGNKCNTIINNLINDSIEVHGDLYIENCCFENNICTDTLITNGTYNTTILHPLVQEDLNNDDFEDIDIDELYMTRLSLIDENIITSPSIFANLATQLLESNEDVRGSTKYGYNIEENKIVIIKHCAILNNNTTDELYSNLINNINEKTNEDGVVLETNIDYNWWGINDIDSLNMNFVPKTWIITTLSSTKQYIFEDTITLLNAGFDKYTTQLSYTSNEEDILSDYPLYINSSKMPLRTALFYSEIGSLTPIKDKTYDQNIYAHSLLNCIEDSNTKDVIVTFPQNKNYKDSSIKINCKVTDSYGNNINTTNNEQYIIFSNNKIFTKSKQSYITDGIATAIFGDNELISQLDLGKYTIDCIYYDGAISRKYEGFFEVSLEDIEIPDDSISMEINNDKIIFNAEVLNVSNKDMQFYITDEYGQYELIKNNNENYFSITNGYFNNLELNFNRRKAGNYLLKISSDKDVTYNSFEKIIEINIDELETYIEFDASTLPQNIDLELEAIIKDINDVLISEGTVEIIQDGEPLYWIDEDGNKQEQFICQNGVISFNTSFTQGVHSLIFSYSGVDGIYKPYLEVFNNINIGVLNVDIRNHEELEEQLNIQIGDNCVLDFDLIDISGRQVNVGYVEFEINGVPYHESFYVQNGVHAVLNIPNTLNVGAYHFLIKYFGTTTNDDGTEEIIYANTVFDKELNVNKMDVEIEVPTTVGYPGKTINQKVILSSKGGNPYGWVEIYLNDELVGRQYADGSVGLLNIPIDIPVISIETNPILLIQYHGDSEYYNASQKITTLNMQKTDVEIITNLNKYYPNEEFDYIVTTQYLSNNSETKLVNKGTINLYIDNILYETQQVVGNNHFILKFDDIKNYKIDIKYIDNNIFKNKEYNTILNIDKIQIKDIDIEQLNSENNIIKGTPNKEIEIKITFPYETQQIIDRIDGIIQLKINNQIINQFSISKNNKINKITIPNLKAGIYKMKLKYLDSDYFVFDKEKEFDIEIEKKEFDIILESITTSQNDIITINPIIYEDINGVLDYYIIIDGEEAYIGSSKIGDSYEYKISNNLKETSYQIKVKSQETDYYKSIEKYTTLTIQKHNGYINTSETEIDIDYGEDLIIEYDCLNIPNNRMINFFIIDEDEKENYILSEKIENNKCILNYTLPTNITGTFKIKAVLEEIPIISNNPINIVDVNIRPLETYISDNSLSAYQGGSLLLPYNIFDINGNKLSNVGIIKYTILNDEIELTKNTNYLLNKDITDPIDIKVEFISNNELKYLSTEKNISLDIQKNNIILVNTESISSYFRGEQLNEIFEFKSLTNNYGPVGNQCIISIDNDEKTYYIEQDQFDRYIVKIDDFTIPTNITNNEINIHVLGDSKYFNEYEISVPLNIKNKTEIYVSATNGDDNNSGDKDVPLQSLSKGYDMISDNGVIYLEEGEYKTNLIINKQISIIGEENKEVIVTPLNPNKNTIYNNSYLTLDNLTFKYDFNENNGLLNEHFIYNDDEILINKCKFLNSSNEFKNNKESIYTNSTIYIKESEFNNNNGSIYISPKSKLVNIESSSFTNNNSLYGGAIYSYNGNDVIIKKCFFKNNTATNGNSLYIQGSAYIKDNYFENKSIREKGENDIISEITIDSYLQAPTNLYDREVSSSSSVVLETNAFNISPENSNIIIRVIKGKVSCDYNYFGYNDIQKIKNVMMLGDNKIHTWLVSNYNLDPNVKTDKTGYQYRIYPLIKYYKNIDEIENTIYYQDSLLWDNFNADCNINNDNILIDNPQPIINKDNITITPKIEDTIELIIGNDIFTIKKPDREAEE